MFSKENKAPTTNNLQYGIKLKAINSESTDPSIKTSKVAASFAHTSTK